MINQLPKRRKPSHKQRDNLVIGFGCLWLLAYFALVGLVLFVAVHFARKYW